MAFRNEIDAANARADAAEIRAEKAEGDLRALRRGASPESLSTQIGGTFIGVIGVVMSILSFVAHGFDFDNCAWLLLFALFMLVGGIGLHERFCNWRDSRRKKDGRETVYL